MKNSVAASFALAAALGLLIGAVDTQTVSDDATKVTLLLIFSAGALGGAIQPRKPWLMALAVGPGLALVHLTAHAFGYVDHVDPNTVTSRLLLLPVGIVASGIGAYLGAFARTVWKSAPSAE